MQHDKLKSKSLENMQGEVNSEAFESLEEEPMLRYRSHMVTIIGISASYNRITSFIKSGPLSNII